MVENETMRKYEMAQISHHNNVRGGLISNTCRDHIKKRTVLLRAYKFTESIKMVNLCRGQLSGVSGSQIF